VTTWDLRLSIAAAKDVLVQFQVVGVPLVSLPLLSAVIGSVVVGLARHNAGAEMSAKRMSAE